MNLIETLQANPPAELVITIDPGHPAYLRDSVNREKFLDGPFEQDEYQPLIDAGQLVESEEFCSVFVLATSAMPPVFSGCDLGQISTGDQKPKAEKEFHGFITEYSAAQFRARLYARCFTTGGIVGAAGGFLLKEKIIDRMLKDEEEPNNG